MLELTQSSIFSRLRGLLEVTRLVRTEADVPELLSAIARTVAESLGFRTVAINLYRPEWDDFVVTTVHGREEARATLLGQVREVSDWEPLLDRRFLQRGAYLIAYGEFDWADMEAYTPDLPVPEDPDAWHPEDALLAPMRGDNGRLLGILSVDEPISGRKPRGDEMDVLVAAAEHAALAVQSAQDSSRARRHREAMTRLLEVSTRLTGVWQTDELLQLVSDAISDALGFAKVSVQLLEDTGRHETVASVGFADGENIGESLSADDLERLLQPRFELEGCYLIPHAEAGALLPTRPAGYCSARDGRGPHAWLNHWLFVPLHDRRGLRVGYIWVDDPADRLLPGAERLQLLRTFANQATTALTAAAQLEALRDSDERHRSLITASPVAIIDFDLDGRVRDWNPAAAQMFGYQAEEVVGRISPTVPAEDLPAFLARIGRVAAGETLRDVQATRMRRDGTSVEVAVSAGPIRNAHGDIVGVVSVMEDIGERMRWERAVLASEARKDAILRSALDCVITVDDEARIVEFNPAAEETFGWTRAEVTGRELLELAIAPEHREDLLRVFTTGKGPLLGSRLEITALRSDRRSFSAEVSLNRVDVPGPALFTVSLRDITKRKRSDERMRDAEAKYRTLVEQIPLATYINETGLPVRTTYISPQVEAMLGYAASDWLQADFLASILHDDDRERVLAEAEVTHRLGVGFRSEYRLVHADGHAVWVLDETVAVRDAEYRPLFLQGFLLDITERRASEEALRQSEELYRLVVENSGS